MNVQQAIDYLLKANIKMEDAGKTFTVDDDFYYIVKSYETKDVEDCKFESHRQYVDIQYMVEGKEAMSVIDINRVNPTTEYNTEKDIMFFDNPKECATLTLSSGNFITFYPNDAHRPSMKAQEKEVILKAIGKVRIK